jgi:hypothetical protein
MANTATHFLTELKDSFNKGKMYEKEIIEECKLLVIENIKKHMKIIAEKCGVQCTINYYFADGNPENGSLIILDMISKIKLTKDSKNYCAQEIRKLAESYFESAGVTLSKQSQSTIYSWKALVANN